MRKQWVLQGRGHARRFELSLRGPRPLPSVYGVLQRRGPVPTAAQARRFELQCRQARALSEEHRHLQRRGPMFGRRRHGRGLFPRRPGLLEWHLWQRRHLHG